MIKETRDQPMGVHGLHRWWYRCLERAGVVVEGATSGRKMHSARHTAGQAVLDKFGDLKLAQKLLMHKHISTTADVYVDYDASTVAEKIAAIYEGEK